MSKTDIKLFTELQQLISLNISNILLSLKDNDGNMVLITDSNQLKYFNKNDYQLQTIDI